MSRIPLMITLSHCRPFFTVFRNPTIYPISFPITKFSSHFTKINSFPTKSTSYLSTLAVSASGNREERHSRPPMSKKARYELPDSVFKAKLNMCSKNNDLKEALSLYKAALKDGISLSIYHYNVLLYLCSSSAASNDDTLNNLGLEMGFELYREMGINKIDPNEATFTSLARLAAAKNDPEMAFDLIKKMKNCGVVPKLRSYEPVLFGFCEKGDADRAYDVDADMLECGVVAEEPELAALLKVSVDAKRGDKVYEMLHRLRASVRQVSEETAKIVEGWFLSETGSGVGLENWDVEKVKEGVARSGGGCHGQGWLGSGKWKVVKAVMDETGVCSCCGEKLVCIDIDPNETEGFATSLSTLAGQREKRANFVQFQEWLRRHGPFDAVVDGANVGMIKTQGFNFRQLNNVVEELREISPSKKMPLIILHIGRVSGGPANNPNAKRMLENWNKAGSLYVTPKGSNDDWYWLYAAVSNKCLLITNDEMRDHLFQLLGNSIFPRWKEKHQVRMTVSRKGLDLHMPPPYSIVIQESEGGSWHLPTVTGDDLETPRQWLCVTRVSKSMDKAKVRVKPQLSNIFAKA
ncbi:proteinaceous RNase P 1, chloroplastic/mitochondrial-like [Silene latifolia]|uniref:proteinaceous RNase P 1, chloroplastic/mitochondrial-like n=1 Tax=Silene latifolia TaxID=37657 RepID=UPI003D782D8D